MKHCEQCNLDFPPGFRFCGSCGGGLGVSVTCEACGEIVDSKWKFCTGCGQALPSSTPFAPSELRAPAPPADSAEIPAPAVRTSTQIAPSPQSHAPQTSPRASTREWYAAPELFEESDDTTAASARPPNVVTATRASSPPAVRHSITPLNNGGSPNGKNIPTLTMLSAYGQHEPMVTTEPARRYSLMLGIVLTVFFAVVGFGAWYLWSHRISAVPAAQPEQTASAGNDLALPSAGETPSQPAAAVESADNEWKRLRERRISAQPSARSTIIASLEAAERKFPSDYRFPYERAKLSIEGITSHHEAFSSLADAAEKAIDNGQAPEMLADLSTDKDGDFWKLARGHHEWHELIEALTDKDKRRLSDLHH